MNELTLDGKTYVSTKQAAIITGYAKDYIGQLCREGYVEAKMVGRSWYVLESSIRAHRFGSEAQSSKTVASKALPATEVVSIVENDEDLLWKPAKYSSEPSAPVIDVFKPIQQAVADFIEEPAPAAVPVATVVEEVAPVATAVHAPEVQDAWKEWFTISEQMRIESPEVLDARAEEYVEEHTPAVEYAPVAEPVIEQVVERVPEPVVRPVVQESAPVEIHKIETVRLPVATFTSSTPAIHESRRSIRPAKSSSPNGVYRTLFMAIAFLCIAVALVGTGLAENYIHASIAEKTPIINFLEGRSTLNR
jgi:hypothetical protein